MNKQLALTLACSLLLFGCTSSNRELQPVKNKVNARMLKSHEDNTQRSLEADTIFSQKVTITSADSNFEEEIILVSQYPDFIKKVTLSDKLLFDFGRSNIKPAVRKDIKTLSSIIKKRYQNEYIFVVGHTDSKGSSGINTRLSAKRAISVVQEMGKSQVNYTKIEIVPAGEFLPKSTNKTARGRMANRRVEILITPNRDMVFDYFRSYGCPEDSCVTRTFKTQKMNRHYIMDTSKRGMQKSEIRTNTVKTKVVKTAAGATYKRIIEGKLVKREIIVEIEPRSDIEVTFTTRTLYIPESYDVQLEDKDRQQLSTQFKGRG